MSCRSRPVTRFPSASLLLDSCFLSGVPTSLPFGLCPLSRLLLFLCFSVCVSLLQFFPDRLPFFCWPTPSLPYPQSPLPFNWPLGWAHLPPPSVSSPTLPPRLPNSPCPSSSSAWARQSSTVSPHHPPTCFPRGFRPLGVTPPKRARTHTPVCVRLSG